jgi:hypothetical protein
MRHLVFNLFITLLRSGLNEKMEGAVDEGGAIWDPEGMEETLVISMTESLVVSMTGSGTGLFGQTVITTVIHQSLTHLDQ